MSNALRLFDFSANGALVWSRVSLPDSLSGAVSSERPLLGQSPYVVNLSLRFHEPATDVSLALVYNVVGPRIAEVGTRVGDQILPNIEEQPFHSLGVVASWELAPHLELKLKAKNVLLRSHELRQGDFVVQRIDPGMSISAGLEYAL